MSPPTPSAGPHRARHRHVSRGHARVRAGRAGARRTLEGGPQLPSRHRPRRRRRAQRARGPAVHLGALWQHHRPAGECISFFLRAVLRVGPCCDGPYTTTSNSNGAMHNHVKFERCHAQPRQV
eukprot:365482-Chlamydomonas_euryale.AAC.20